MCVCVGALLGCGYKVGRDLRHCNTKGINSPSDNRDFQNITKPCISTFSRIFLQELITKVRKTIANIAYHGCSINSVLEKGFFFPFPKD